MGLNITALLLAKKYIDEKFKTAENIHPQYTPVKSGIYKITVDELGHISSAVPITKKDVIDADIFPEYDFSVDDEGELTYSVKGE